MGKVVGILSMQRVLNYGSFLQAYALKQLLLQNGADEVYFIDIEKGRSLPGYEPGRSIWSKACTAFSFLLKGRLVSQLKDRQFMIYSSALWPSSSSGACSLLCGFVREYYLPATN